MLNIELINMKSIEEIEQEIEQELRSKRYMFGVQRQQTMKFLEIQKFGERFK